MFTSDFLHQPVLLEEATSLLITNKNGCYIDGTFGRGGHTKAILSQLTENGFVLAIDKDPSACKVAAELQRDDKRLVSEHASYRSIKELADKYDLSGKINGILLDLGVSSPQLEDSTRGFSFSKEGPLDMRMDTTKGLTASAWLNRATAEEISDVLFSYGEERHARKIARAIVKERAILPIETTQQLVAIIKAASPPTERNKHPATRTFQAIRIFINKELEDLKICLSQCLEILALNGRLVVITFHSLEDRLVKRFLREHAQPEKLPRELPIKTIDTPLPRLRILTKPLKASPKEINANPRARSATLRAAEKQS